MRSRVEGLLAAEVAPPPLFERSPSLKIEGRIIP
jgi:hypothetical protein